MSAVAHIRRTTNAVAQATYRASSLARHIRSHGHPARVVIGRKRGEVCIRVASLTTSGWMLETLPPTRDAVATWLGY